MYLRRIRKAIPFSKAFLCKMDKVVLCSFFYVILLLVSAQTYQQDPSDSAPVATKRKTADPVANFFSELGDLFLDIDDTFNKQTAPKVDLEETLVEQIINENRRRRSAYFNRIRENYRNLQQRIGSAITERPLDLFTSPDIFGLNVQSKGQKSSVDLSLPFLPMKMSLKSELPPKKVVLEDTLPSTSSTEETTPAIPEAKSESGDFEGKIEVMDTGINVQKKGDSTTVDISQRKLSHKSLTDAIKQVASQKPMDIVQERLHKLVPTEADLKKALEKLLEDSKRTNELLNSLTRMDANEMSQTLTSRSGMVASENSEDEPKGRILGDLLFSESTFDKHMKEVLKSSKWLIDPPSLLPREGKAPAMDRENAELSESRTNRPEDATVLKETDSEIDPESVTESYIPLTSGAQLRDQMVTVKPLSAYYYEVGDIDKRQGDINILLPTEGHGEEVLVTSSEAPEFSNQFTEIKECSILAFTPDGVPLKLRISPDVENPLKFLHEVLSEADVSLNIPIESYDDLEPAGKEVLQLGAGNGGIITRALYLDLSDKYELRALLKTLKKFKDSQTCSTS